MVHSGDGLAGRLVAPQRGPCVTQTQRRGGCVWAAGTSRLVIAIGTRPSARGARSLWNLLSVGFVSRALGQDRTRLEHRVAPGRELFHDPESLWRTFASSDLVPRMQSHARAHVHRAVASSGRLMTFSLSASTCGNFAWRCMTGNVPRYSEMGARSRRCLREQAPLLARHAWCQWSAHPRGAPPASGAARVHLSDMTLVCSSLHWIGASVVVYFERPCLGRVS